MSAAAPTRKRRVLTLPGSRVEAGTAAILSPAGAAELGAQVRAGKLTPAVDVVVSGGSTLTVDSVTGERVPAGEHVIPTPSLWTQGRADKRSNVARVRDVAEQLEAKLVRVDASVADQVARFDTRESGETAARIAYEQEAGRVGLKALPSFTEFRIEWAEKHPAGADVDPLEAVRRLYEEEVAAPLGIVVAIVPLGDVGPAGVPVSYASTGIDPHAGDLTGAAPAPHVRHEVRLPEPPEVPTPWTAGEVTPLDTPVVMRLAGVGPKFPGQGRVAHVQYTPPAGIKVSDDATAVERSYPDRSALADDGPQAWTTGALRDLADSHGQTAPSVVLVDTDAAQLLDLDALAKATGLALGVMR